MPKCSTFKAASVPSLYPNGSLGILRSDDKSLRDQQSNEPLSEEPSNDYEDVVSLDELSRAFANAIDSGHSDHSDTNTDRPAATIPFPSTNAEPDSESNEDDENIDSSTELDWAFDEELEQEYECDEDAMQDEEACPIGPRSIFEAMLFMGDPGNRPLSPHRAADLMRGVDPDEITEIVAQLNRQYREDDCPYLIVLEETGYRLTLLDDYNDVRNRFYGKIREAKLSPAAIEILALIAYRQPLSGEEINAIRSAPSGNLLAQLVRRSLLHIERKEEDGRMRIYYSTTERFLELFQLESLDDLPQLGEWD